VSADKITGSGVRLQTTREVRPDRVRWTGAAQATNISDTSCASDKVVDTFYLAFILQKSLYRSVGIMAIRKVLLPLISTGAGEAALSTAWIIARLWNAHMSVLHVQTDLAPAPAMSAMFRRFTVEHQVKVAEAAVGAEGATASFLILTGRRLDILPQQARLADLTVVRHPATPEEVSSSDTLHAVLFDSGRPLLIAPQVAPPTVGRRICLGWNGSAESAAAVEAAMPWLQRAEAVRILWAEEYQRRGPQAPDLQAHLAMHGVPADLKMFKPIDKVVGAGLLAAASEFNCDLLTMGAYAHSRLRQQILGGVTRHILEHATLPVMMHR
jgi:nucleotide-binding universal stress UspA family protein